MTKSGRNTHPIRSFYDAMHQDLKDYFKKSWLEMTGSNEKTFYNRLDRPQIFDVVLFRHLTGIKIEERLLNGYPEIKKLTPFRGQSTLDL